jgi:nitroimidazol reductase NimA-like FMN-containing flavoprotein (pyridoxamine 5'-phosphate oxidase superfamily)
MHEQVVPPGSDEGKVLHELDDTGIEERIRALLAQEPFAVLCTQAGGQPYGSLIAVAFSPDLRTCCFTTSVATRKYRLLCECKRVALVVDNRDQYPGDLMQTSALTITGRADRVSDEEELERWSALLVARHAYLRRFVAAPSTAVFRIEVARYLYVTRFQEVRQWIPA